MGYTAIEAFSRSLLRTFDVPGVAMLDGGTAQRLLLTGGEKPMAYRLDGESEGSLFDLGNAGSAMALIFSGISFEVDLESRYRPAMIEQPLGCLVIRGGVLHVIGLLRGGAGFEDAWRIPIGGPAPASHDGDEIGFKKWRAIQKSEGETRQIIEYEATRLGDF